MVRNNQILSGSKPLDSRLTSDFLGLLKCAPSKEDNFNSHRSNLLMDINEKKLMNDSHSLMSQDNNHDPKLLYLPVKRLELQKDSNKISTSKPLGEIIGLTENGDPIYEG